MERRKGFVDLGEVRGMLVWPAADDATARERDEYVAALWHADSEWNNGFR
jgi:hypothetical protein